jgi:hypothetical protein
MAYDPVKAHEYYMKHRKLKGRHSTKGMSESQKKQWESAKQGLSEEHKAISKGITAHENTRKEQASIIAKFRIQQIRNRLEYVPKAKRAEFRKKLGALIDNIRKDLSTKKGRLTQKAIAGRAAERTAWEGRKDQAYQQIKGQ